VFRIGSNSTIDSLNPFVAFNGDAYTTFEYVYPYLVQFNPKLQFVADFARSWQHEPDGTVWTFHTQPNAKWSDGKPLTAADAPGPTPRSSSTRTARRPTRRATSPT
jgi:peptide/nickel transport system substrate-binding protein